MSVRLYEEERQERERKLKLENVRLRKENADLSQIVLGETYDEFMAQRKINRLREALENITKVELNNLATDVWNEAVSMKKIARQALGGEKNE